MTNIRHILRLHTQGMTKAEIIGQTGISQNGLRRYLKEFKQSGLSFSEINALNDDYLKGLFAKPPEPPISEKLEKLYTLFPSMDKELKRKGVTQLMLWEEYKIKHPDGIGSTLFFRSFKNWKSRITPTMRKEHKAGDKLYIDFAGQKLAYFDREINETKQVEVFVAILGASQLTFVEAIASQQKEDFIGACEDALHYYGGVPSAIVPDNLKSAVTKSSKYEPTINETFADFAEHYNTTILPTRAYHPKDKALVESAVNIIYTRIYAKIRNEKFYSLEELNKSIGLALEEHNNQIVTGRNYSRRQLFEDVEYTTLLPLPVLRYEFKKQQYVTVKKDGYISLTADKHFYSIPYRFIGKKVKVMFSRYNVEVFYNYERIALHIRSKNPFKYTTDKEHLAPNHRFVSELSPERCATLAEEIHKDVKLYILKILEQSKYQEQACKVCLGVLDLAKKVGNERLTKACQRGLNYGIYNYGTIKKILEKSIDKQENDESEQLKMPEHGNIRGKDYYK